ncbi:MAG: protein of unknown function transrane, partial [Ilumatobacteraceae bacterium]|nr:protein of unknown function transrane [Ilumatobacteraceae bacterium]
MAIALALSAALAYGSADFVGGLAARRTSPLLTAFGAQLTGLVVLLVAMPLLGTTAPAAHDLAFGAIAGVFGGTGIVLLYRALAAGPMSVVAPTTALAASVVPILSGVLLGERPGPLAFAGIAVSLVAVALITRERASEAHVPAGRAVIALALGGGAIFGMFFVFLHQTGDDAGLWPLLAARLVSVPLLALLIARQVGLRNVEVPRLNRSVVVSGTLDMGANICYLLALRHGMLSVV